MKAAKVEQHFFVILEVKKKLTKFFLIVHLMFTRKIQHRADSDPFLFLCVCVCVFALESFFGGITSPKLFQL